MNLSQMALQNNNLIQRFSFVSFGAEEEAISLILPEETPVEDNFVLKEELEKQKQEFEATLQTVKMEAEKQAYKNGYDAAKAEISVETKTQEEAIKNILETLSNRITLAAEDNKKQLDSQQEKLTQISLAIAKKVAGDALKNEPYNNIKMVVKECLGLIIDEPKIVIGVSAQFAVGLKQRVDNLRISLQGFNGDIIIEENPNIADYDARVEWKNGFAERNTDAIWKEIEQVILRGGNNGE